MKSTQKTGQRHSKRLSSPVGKLSLQQSRKLSQPAFPQKKSPPHVVFPKLLCGSTCVPSPCQTCLKSNPAESFITCPLGISERSNIWLSLRVWEG